MINIKQEVKTLCKTQEEKEIGLLLIDNLWDTKAVAAKSRFSARKIAPLKTRLRHSLIIRLWKQYDLNQAEIAKLTDTERHTVSRVLKPLGYTVKRDHKVEHQRYLEKTYQELLQMDQPSVASLDSFIMLSIRIAVVYSCMCKTHTTINYSIIYILFVKGRGYHGKSNGCCRYDYY